MIAIEVYPCLIGKDIKIINSGNVGFFLRLLSFAYHSFGVQNLPLNASRQLICRRTKINRYKTFTFNANGRRCNYRTYHRSDASNDRVAASRLRNVVGARANVCQATQQVSVSKGVLTQVRQVRVGRLDLRDVNYVIVGLHARRGSTIRRRAKGRIRLHCVRLTFLRSVKVRVTNL